MPLRRRLFLRSAGVSLALPWLNISKSARATDGLAQAPSTSEAAPSTPAASASSDLSAPTDPSEPPRSLICICAPLGFYPGSFLPEEKGPGYKPSPYLELLAAYRKDFTVISGLAGISGGHQAIDGFLTGVPGAGQPGIRNGISVDQYAAELIGQQTRFPSLALSGDGLGLSWTRTGARVPAHQSPSRLFAEMFLDGDEKETQRMIRIVTEGQSILDGLHDALRRLEKLVGAEDRRQIDEYMTSIREFERELATMEKWIHAKKPQVDSEPPEDITDRADLIGRTRLLFTLAHLAILTDSTRLITIMLAGATSVPPIPGVSSGHHDLSHHGKDPGKLAQLKLIEEECIKVLGELLSKFSLPKTGDRRLLDNTMIYLGSNLGDASSHSTMNLPILLAGGGFRHGQHLAFDPQNPPSLCNLYVSMLQRLGIETDRFSTGTSTLTGLEFA
ncbi:MAG: hypothetical protein RI963_3146 [Planctomycetota bacterium]